MLQTIRSTRGMVTASHHLAAEAGLRCLRDGGNAIEAMVAADVLALAATADGATESPTCPTCGPRPETDAVFCSQCGKLLPHPAQCAECKAPLEPGGKFCGRCGAEVGEVTA